MWNEKNLFTVPLTKKGVEEAIQAGKRISYIPVDIIFTSVLIRAKMTAMLSMTQHHHKKVPVIIHNENEQATAWTRIYSEKTISQSIPVITAWQLNERMYGDLTSRKLLKDMGRRKCTSGVAALIFLLQRIEPHLKSGRHVMVAAHGNSLRSIIMS
ncbi:hypothetical protein PIB30_019341 [Stylosanthes scabra]|uniref:phosphoglycerate mutase (2,3-diphosphoglycerate-dependent) n=1 Tax=Stylosanthes scabra TaxID=79078 RepID=A0ABU6WA66_9FABA|nr:hypothetical protein [Stylosanthes scabra]